MSSPTSRLSKLSLGSSMPTTRAQSLAMSQAGQQDTAEDDSSSETESSELEYDTGELTPRSKEQFEAARESRLALTHCGERNGGLAEGKYYVFEMLETKRYSVRIQQPGKKYGHLPCSPCNEQPGGPPCRHVFWLTDQIARHVLTEPQKDDVLTLTRRGYPSGIPDPYHQIESRGIENLAEDAGWQISEQDGKGDSLNRQKRASKIRAIMAALSPSMTSDEYRPDIFDELHREDSIDHLVVKGDLEATVARILMANNDVFYQFRSLISPNYCASDFFQKMQDRAQRTLEEMDNYFANGGSADLTEAHDVAWCARLLTDIVASIRNLLENLTLGRAAKDKAAKSLIYILGEVAHRDLNNYEGPLWRHSQQRLLPERERNLYHRLINTPDRATGSSFVISELDLIDPSAAHYSVTDLDEIFDAMTAAPSDYKRRFRELINRWKSVEVSAGQKRPGEAAGSSPKRRMK